MATNGNPLPAAGTAPAPKSVGKTTATSGKSAASGATSTSAQGGGPGALALPPGSSVLQVPPHTSVEVKTDTDLYADAGKSAILPLAIVLLIVFFFVLFKKQLGGILDAVAHFVRTSKSLDVPKFGKFERDAVPPEQRQILASPSLSDVPLSGCPVADPVTPIMPAKPQPSEARAEQLYEMFRFELLYRLSSLAQREFVRDLVGAVLDDRDVDERLEKAAVPASEREAWLRWLTDKAKFVAVEDVAGQNFYRLTDVGMKFIDHIARTSREKNRYVAAETLDALGVLPQ